MRLAESTRGRVLQVGTWLLGLLFVVAAGLKALEFAAFVQQVERYRLIPESLSTSAAGGLILAEAALGVFCLVGFQTGKALWGMCGLLALFIVATSARWGSLVGTDCACFGSASTGGPGAVLLHGSLMLGVAGGLIFLRRGAEAATPYRRFRAAAGVTAAVLITFAVQPTATPLSQTVPRGDALRVFMSATCSKCMSEASRVKNLSASPAAAPVQVFIGADFDRQIKDFLKGAGVDLEYTPLTFPQLAREARHVPTVQLFHGGKLLREWVGRVPSPEEVRELLTTDPGITIDGQKQADVGKL